MFVSAHLRKVTQLLLCGLCLGIFVGPSNGLPEDDQLNVADGLVYWRWIGSARQSMPSEGCPLPRELGPGWTAERLFDGQMSRLYPALQDFCLWQYDGSLGPVSETDLHCMDSLDGHLEHPGEYGGEPTESSVSTLCASADFIDVEPDMMAVVAADPTAMRPQGEAGLLDKRLEQRFLSQAGFPWQALPVISSAQKPWLTLIDTSPTSASPPSAGGDNSSHGETLRLLARRLLCGSPVAGPDDCIATIRSRLALAYTSSHPLDPKLAARDEVRGGYSGLISELGQAVIDETDDWLALPRRASLWINLSVAWDRLYGGTGSFAGMSPAIKAVYRALEAAACQDVGIIASAGNLRDLHRLNSSADPMLPAAWTEYPSSLCASARPMVWAAGAFDARKEPLSNALPKGIPEFVAFADHPVLVEGLTHPSPAMAGSSVAAINVSAAAAAASFYWRLNPYPQVFSVPALMNLVYASGEQVSYGSQQADFCSFSYPGSGCPPVRYVSVCEAAHAALGINTPLELPGCRPRSEQLLSISGLDLSEYSVENVVGYPSCGLSDCYASCREDMPSTLTGMPTTSEVCPRRQRHSVARQPGTQPQPEEVACPACVHDPDGGLFYGTVTLGPGRQLKAPTLHLICAGNEETFMLETDLANDDNGSTPRIRFSIVGLPTGCESASFSYTMYQDGKRRGSTTLPVILAGSDDLGGGPDPEPDPPWPASDL